MAPVILNVTTTADTNTGSSGGGLSLRHAITLANQNPRKQYQIQLRSGQTYKLTLQGNREHFNKTGDLDIVGSNVVIKTVGGSTKATIDASELNQPDSVFHIWNGAKVAMDNVVVTGGNLPESQQSGGGLFITGGSDVTLTRSHLTDNTASRGAGAYVSEGTLNFVDSRIYLNTAKSAGGGVFIKEGELSVANSTFDGNKALTDTGGGIYAWEEGFDQIDVDIRSSVFSNNAADAGGAISTYEGVKLDVHDSRFVDNTAKGAEGGGAIALIGENSDLATLSVTGETLFRGNVGENTTQGGGAIYGQLAKIDIAGAQFENNRLIGAGDAAGGAIFARDFSALEVSGSRFTKNSVKMARSGSGEGGAIAAENSTDVEIFGGVFDSNSSSNTGGAMRLADGDHIIQDATFSKNRAALFGGAMALSETDSAVISNVLYKNNTSSSGGAFSLESGFSEWKNNTRLLNNHATGAAGGLAVGDGGGGFIRGGNHKFTQITAQQNTADKDGGFLSIQGTNNKADIQVSRSDILKNRAEDDGGGIDIYADTQHYSTLKVTDTIVDQNTAGDSGGGIRTREGAEVSLSGVKVTGNKAGGGANPAQGIVGQGGGLSSLGGRIAGKNVIVSGNKAAFGGGGIAAAISNGPDNSRGLVHLTNSAITRNLSTLSSAGGVLAGQGSEVTFTNTQINENRAAGEGAAILGLDSGIARPAAKVKLFNTTIARNVVNTNRDRFGKSAVFMETGGKPIGFGLVSDPAQFEIYNSILANTTNGEGQRVNDFDGTKPVNTGYSLVSKIGNANGWQDRNNLLNTEPKLIFIGNGLYSPTSQSPVVNKGSNSRIPLDRFDLDGDGNRQERSPRDQGNNSRVKNTQVDMGAIEVQGTSQTPPSNPPTTPTTGSNVIRGTNLADRLRGTTSNDKIYGLGRADTLFGKAGADELFGGEGNDRMFGNEDDDILFGGAGNDRQFGNQGRDILSGGAGFDTLMGGGDRDMFVIAKGEGRDRIRDFAIGTDIIGLAGNLSLGQIGIVQIGRNTHLKNQGDTLAILNQVQADSLIAAAGESFLELNT